MKLWPFSQRGARWFLLASLCVNIALATYVSVQWFQSGWSPVGAGIPLRMMERVAARLPQDDADILWRVYHSKEPEILPLQMEYTRLLIKTMRLTAQPELDKDALRAAVMEAREKRVKIGDVSLDAGADFTERTTSTRRRLSSLRFAGRARVQGRWCVSPTSMRADGRR